MNIFAQNNSVDTGCVLLDIDYKGTIPLYDKPDGKVIKNLGHNFEGEDFIVFEILNKNDSMFFVNTYYAIEGSMIEGWIFKNAHLGIYDRAVLPYRPLILYSKPNTKESIIVESKDYTIDIHIVIDSEGTWLKIRTIINNKEYEGWISPDMQCCNPYTTCN